MRKTAVLRVVLAAVTGLGVWLAWAQNPPQPLDLQKVTDNLYVIIGDGGNTAFMPTSEGVILVDDKFAADAPQIAAKVKTVTDKPIRYVLNTHQHGDHTGGNENLGKMGVTIFAREELRNRLAHPAPGANGAPGTPAPAAALPVITYSTPLTFHMDGDDVQAIPIPKAHTDGDTLVYFPNANVIMIGDYFRSLGYPNIDRTNGGSLPGMLAGIDKAISLCNATTKVVPGHGAITDRNGLIAHRDMIIAIRDKIAPMVSQGKTLEEVVASKPTAAYDAKVPGVGTTGDRFIGQVYAELKAGK